MTVTHADTVHYVDPPYVHSTRSMRTVAVLFARADSHYKALPGVDVWDRERDARRWPGGAVVVAHPPCRAWGALRTVAKPRPDEKALALLAVEHVRRHGGVLEHPAASTLWKVCGLADPGTIDAAGGRCITVDQWHWGHKASKPTRLYFVGVRYDELPPQPRRTGKPTHCITQGHGIRRGMPGFLPRVTDAEREHTPPAFAAWLVDLARRCAASGAAAGRRGAVPRDTVLPLRALDVHELLRYEFR